MFGFGISGSFDPDTEIGDLSGKVILVTGGNAGLGKECVLRLAKHNPKEIFITSRSTSKAQSAIEGIKTTVPNANISIIELDLTDFASIEKAVKDFQSKSDRLDLLLNNAGVMAMPYSQTKQGYEIQFGTNHMGHALFTKHLIPTLLKTAEQPGSDVRIVNLSSYGHNLAPAGGIIFDQQGAEKIDTNARYGSSKLANILHARILAEKYPQITTTAVHPGVIMTDLYASVKESTIKSTLLGLAGPLFFADLQTGALTSLWALTAPKETVGKEYYFEPIGKTGQASKYARDHDLAVKLWDYTEEELKKHGY
ncbi:hypothetical protein B9Z65_8371 [Elsinoe australis]|uniref:Uncharacterized protein n=1 Tax=Elsinoe australis TaxID=40998 RepID=A0A2P7YDM7_9PEZI|nr:hypothetical protein B9Z65_8371 [Elsinoe australis]